MIHVSIVVGSQIENIFNLRDMVAYAKERGLVCEVVKTINDAKAKYVFIYNTTYYYMDYYIHWSYLRLSMPVGFEPGDPDLPEKLIWNHYMVSDGKIIGQVVEDHSDFFLRKQNGFKTSIREGGVYGLCKPGKVDKPMFMDQTLESQITMFFSK